MLTSIATTPFITTFLPMQMNSNYFAVFSRNHTITCECGDNGTLSFIAVGTTNLTRYDLPEKTVRDMAMDIIQQCPNPIVDVKKPHYDSEIALGIYTYITKFLRAYNIIVDVMLSPYTAIGKKRLLGEFELIIS